MGDKMKKKSNEDSITIPKNVLAGISSVIAVSALLLSKNQPGPLLLFLVGVGTGIFIGINLKKRQK